MDMKETVNWLNHSLVMNNDKAHATIKLLQRGEKYEVIEKGIKQYCLILENQNVLKEIIRLEQKYFPKPVKKTTEMTQKEIYPWWNTLTKDKKMDVYFKYYSSGTYDDCIEWWDKIDIKVKILVHDTWCEEVN